VTTSLVGYLALFAGVAFGFLFVAMLIGRVLRAQVPTAEKLRTYECGEVPVGSSFIQYDLRFYVVALVFIIFEVEVALFFPPATIFGKATRLMNPTVAADAEGAGLCEQLGIRGSEQDFGTQETYPPPADVAADARTLALATMIDLGLFFAVILLGFGYVWWRGDLDWVRATSGAQLRMVTTSNE
jgi:NADH-quinone oxidoreductase subunit A